jgi:hypothetical protein
MAVPAVVSLDESVVDRYALERFEARPVRLVGARTPDRAGHDPSG